MSGGYNIKITLTIFPFSSVLIKFHELIFFFSPSFFFADSNGDEANNLEAKQEEECAEANKSEAKEEGAEACELEAEEEEGAETNELEAKEEVADEAKTEGADEANIEEKQAEQEEDSFVFVESSDTLL